MSAERRVLRIQFLRGTGWVAAIGTLAVGALLLYSLAGDWAGWAGRWMPLAASVRMSLFAIGAVTLAAAAWQAGRERRRRTGELLDSTPRPPWQRLLLSWGTVTGAACSALLVLVVTCSILVAPVASWQPDLPALAPVCTDSEPEVCLTRQNAFLLDDVARVAGAELARWSGIPGGRRGPWAHHFPIGLALRRSRLDSARHRLRGRRRLGNPSVREYLEPSHGRALDRLLAIPNDEQRAWMGGYLAAARSCDETALTALAADLR